MIKTTVFQHLNSLLVYPEKIAFTVVYGTEVSRGKVDITVDPILILYFGGLYKGHFVVKARKVKSWPDMAPTLEPLFFSEVATVHQE